MRNDPASATSDRPAFLPAWASSDSDPGQLSRDDVLHSLCASGEVQEKLFVAARAARERYFGNRVILRGVIEITNLCRVECTYCPMRRANTAHNDTYVMAEAEILRAAREIRASGIDVVFLQGGEIPQTTRVATSVIPKILDLFHGEVEVLLNLGNKPREDYAQLRQAGATSYILKHETSDPDLHLATRGETLHERFECMRSLLELGFRVGTGTIVGLPGQSLDSLADDVLLPRRLGVHMASASPFVPAADTPLAAAATCSTDLALNAIAALRLANPDCLIPSVSALERAGAGGQRLGLLAGANVLTVNFTPASEKRQYLIYGKERFVVRLDHVRRLISECGLEPSGSLWRAGSGPSVPSE